MASPPTPVRLQIHLQPRAARTRIVGRYGAAIKVQVQAPPVDGAANAALIGLLATLLEVPRRSVHIIHGVGGRDKVVEIDTADPVTCRARLEALLPPRVDKLKHAG